MSEKRILALLAALVVFVSAAGMLAFADSEGINVYVTVANGRLELARRQVTATDTDGDGAITVSDALYAAHEAYYDGGAAAGYCAVSSDYGLSLTRLWGAENGDSYSYYVNNVSAMSLADLISDGDSISAFVYTDLTEWSDTYCYFEQDAVSVSAGSEISVTLLAAGYDENWNPTVVPVEGASITVNGTDSGAVTDAEGKASVVVAEAGENIISAVSSSMNLVPPVCVATVEGAPSDAGEIAPLYILYIVAAVAVAATAAVITVRSKRNK